MHSSPLHRLRNYFSSCPPLQLTKETLDSLSVRAIPTLSVRTHTVLLHETRCVAKRKARDEPRLPPVLLRRCFPHRRYVSAEIPPDTRLELRETVLSLMTHLDHRKAGYPKPLCAATRHNARKRPEYRRRPSAPAGAAVRH